MSEITFAIESYGGDRRLEQSVSRYLQMECYHTLAMAFHKHVDYRVHVLKADACTDNTWERILKKIRSTSNVPHLILIAANSPYEVSFIDKEIYGIITAQGFRYVDKNNPLVSIVHSSYVVDIEVVCTSTHINEISRADLYEVFKTFLTRHNLIKEPSPMALKHSQTFKILGVTPIGFNSLITTASNIVERFSPFVFDNNYSSHTRFVICFTSSITRNYKDHTLFIQQILNEQKQYGFDILFINLCQFIGEIDELVEYVKNQDPSYVFNENVKWMSFKICQTNDLESNLKGILSNYISTLKSIPNPEMKVNEHIRTVAREDYDKDMRLMQKQIDDLQKKYDKVQLVCSDLNSFLEKMKVEMVSGLVDTVTPLIQTIVMEQMKANFHVQYITRVIHDSFDDTLNDKIKKMLSSVDKNLLDKYPDNPTFDQYVEEAIKLPSASADEAPEEIQPMTSDDYYRAVIEHLQDKKYEGGLHCVVFSTEKSFEELMEQFKTTLDLSIEDFYNQNQEIFMTKDNKTYGMNRIGGICDTYDFYKVIDVLQIPQDEIKRAALKQSRFLQIIRDYFMKQFGFIVTWLAE